MPYLIYSGSLGEHGTYPSPSPRLSGCSQPKAQTARWSECSRESYRYDLCSGSRRHGAYGLWRTVYQSIRTSPSSGWRPIPESSHIGNLSVSLWTALLPIEVSTVWPAWLSFENPASSRCNARDFASRVNAAGKVRSTKQRRSGVLGETSCRIERNPSGGPALVGPSLYGGSARSNTFSWVAPLQKRYRTPRTSYCSESSRGPCTGPTACRVRLSQRKTAASAPSSALRQTSRQAPSAVIPDRHPSTPTLSRLVVRSLSGVLSARQAPLSYPYAAGFAI